MDAKRPCPHCDTPILVGAIKCRWCGEMLEARRGSPPPADRPDPSGQDREHLRLLSIFHYVVGTVTALFSFFPIIHVVVGFLFLSQSGGEGGSEGPPAMFGLIFVFAGACAVLGGWTLAGLTLYAGRCLANNRRHTFCTVTACLNCIIFPFGTILGVLTLIVLSRPSVKQRFESAPPS